MAKLSKTVEACFMNELPFPLREAAKELYRYVMLEQLLEIRQGQIPPGLVKKHNLTLSQWRRTSNAVILTKLSLFSPGNHMPQAMLKHLRDMVGETMGLPSAKCDVVYEELKEDAPVLAAWYKDLLKLIKH